MPKKTKSQIYDEYMTLFHSFKRYQNFYGAVSYCFLNEKRYQDWDRVPTARDMCRISYTYEDIQKQLNKLFKEYINYGKSNYPNK